MGQQKQAAKSSTVQAINLDSVPVKNLLKENSALTNVHLKERVAKLRYSTVLQIDNPPPVDPYKKLRKQTLLSLVEAKLVLPAE